MLFTMMRLPPKPASFRMPEADKTLRPFKVVFASRRSLLPVLRFTLHAAILDAGFSQDTADDMETVLDEALSNIIEHTYRNHNDGEVELVLHFSSDRVTLMLSDRGEKFNPFEMPEVDMENYFRENQTGGLGVHMIRALVNEASYLPRDGGGNTLMLVKIQENAA